MCGLLFEASDGLTRFLVEPGPQVVVGRRPPRDSDRNVWIPGSLASRQHFRVRGGEDGFVLEDTSAGGTYIDGERVNGTSPIGPGAVVTGIVGLAFTVRAFAGETLWKRIARAPLAVRDAIRMLADVARQLAPLHAAGRHLGQYSPRHILCGDDGRFALLVTNWPTTDEHGEVMLGNPLYVAPDDRLGPPSDLYTLGLIFYEALSQRRAYDHDTPMQTLMAKRHGAMPPFAPHWDLGVQGFLHALLATDPTHRFTAAQLCARIEEPHLD